MKLLHYLKSLATTDPLLHLKQKVIDVNNIRELQKLFGWRQDPILDRPDIHNFDYPEDLNERRIRDAESLAVVVRNAEPAVLLEIGTADGMATVLMAANAPKARIYTVNIPPEELASGKGGQLTTSVLEREKIGAAYRARGLDNIIQIYANTATWEPDIGAIDVAFIDGCHDADFVYNDTRKILKQMRPGAFILWHDFNLYLTPKYHWIYEVCRGVERLYAEGILGGRIFQLRDSWIGIYRV